METVARRAMRAQGATASQPASRAPMLWGVAVGLLQAATPLLFWWLNTATVYALGTVAIAAIYVGFAVADGRPKVIAVEGGVAMGFVVLAAVAGTGSPWLLVVALAGPGPKNPWRHRTPFLWGPPPGAPLCMT